MKFGLEVKIIQTGTIRKLGCRFLFAFHSKYGHILIRCCKHSHGMRPIVW